MRVRSVVSAAVMIGASTSLVWAEARWPQFRGIGGSGVAGEGALPVQFGPEKNVLWKIALPRGHSSPCVWDDRIFLTGFDAAKQQLETYCVDRATGALLWRRAAPAETIEKVYEVSSPAAPTPATDGQRVYVYFGSCGLLCYDYAGNEQWRIRLPIPNLYFGTGASPIVAGRTVLLNVDEEGDSFLLAVDGRSGEVLWKHDRKQFPRGWSTPVHWHNEGVDEIVVSGARQLTAYDLKDGAPRWWVFGLPTQATATPVVGAARLFATVAHEFGGEESVIAPPPFDDVARKADADEDGLVARNEVPADLVLVDRRRADGVGNVRLRDGYMFNRFDRDKDGKLSREEWGGVERFATEVKATVLAVEPGGHGEVSESHVAWRGFRGVPEVPSPLFYEGRVYLVTKGGVLTVLAAKTGKTLSRTRLGAGGAYYASPVAGDGKLYAVSSNGVVTVLGTGEHPAILTQNDLGETVMATPALVDGKIYVRTERHLYAFGQ